MVELCLTGYILYVTFVKCSCVDALIKDSLVNVTPLNTVLMQILILLVGKFTSCPVSCLPNNTSGR